jgi:beta-galactosidase/beta-glucuronidase
MRFSLFDWLLKDYDFDPNYKIKIKNDEGNEYCLVSLCAKLAKEVEKLENRIIVLEEENVQTTNELYRLQNSLDARIDILVEHYRMHKDV